MSKLILSKFHLMVSTADEELQRKVGAALHMMQTVARHMIYDNINDDPSTIDYYGQMNERINYYSEYVKAVLQIRKMNLVNYAKRNDYNIISLGLDCLPRSISAKYGLIVSREMGRKAGPFDLGVHKLSGMIAAIENRFNKYGDIQSMTINKNGHICDESYGAIFNHDTKWTNLEAGFESLSEKLKKRVKSFEDYVTNPGFKIFFVHLPFSKNPSDIALIYETIKQRNSIFDYFVYALSTLHSNPKRKIFSKMGCWSCIPFPSENYVWHSVSSFITDEGIIFENTLLEELYGILDTKV